MRSSDWSSDVCSSDLNDAADAKLVAEPLLDKRVRRECGDRSVKRDCHRVVGAELPEKPVPLDKARKEKRLCRRIEVAHRMRIEGCHQQEPTLAARKGRRVAHDSLVADVKTVEIPKRQDGAAHRWCERELRQHVSPLP